jgi:hypothetical protein
MYVRRFVPEEDMRSDIESTFVKLYSLDEQASTQATVDMAIASPHAFVLKPQREGGGKRYWVVVCVWYDIFDVIMQSSLRVQHALWIE